MLQINITWDEGPWPLLDHYTIIIYYGYQNDTHLHAFAELAQLHFPFTCPILIYYNQSSSVFPEVIWFKFSQAGPNHVYQKRPGSVFFRSCFSSVSSEPIYFCFWCGKMDQILTKCLQAGVISMSKMILFCFQQTASGLVQVVGSEMK